MNGRLLQDWPEPFLYIGFILSEVLGHESMVKHAGGIATSLAGLTLIGATPLLVLSESVRWHLRVFGGVTAHEEYIGPGGGGHWVHVNHERGRAVFSPIRCCLVCLGMHLIQRARELPRYGPPPTAH